jgi:hypothetical protein
VKNKQKKKKTDKDAPEMLRAGNRFEREREAE